MGVFSRRVLSCGKCDLEQEIGFRLYPRARVSVYDFGNGKLLPILFKDAWCLDCNALSRTEDIPSGLVVKERLDTYKLNIRDFQNGRAAWIGQPLVDFYKSVIANETFWMQWARERRPSRCVECGGQQFMDMEVASLASMPDGPLKWTHPDCGGQLVLGSDENGTHIDYREIDANAPLVFERFTPEGFPARNLRIKINDEFPEMGELMFQITAREAKFIVDPARNRQTEPATTNELEQEMPEIVDMVRLFVSEEVAGKLHSSRSRDSLKAEYPEIYEMFRMEARRIIAETAKAHPGSLATLASKQDRPAPLESQASAFRLDDEGASAMHKNPFWLLGVNTRDGRHKIMERAEERALHADPAECQKARSDLTNPRTRLAAEVAWLPGVAPRMAEKLVASLSKNPLNIASQTGIPEIGRANLMAAALEVVDPAGVGAQALADFMQAMGAVVDGIEPETILRDINEDRSVSGFAEVPNVAMVEEEIEARKKSYKAVLKEALNGMPSAMILETMGILVDQSTDCGESPAPSLIDDLVDSYEVETQGVLEKEQANITKLAQSAVAAAPTGARGVDAILDKLEPVVRNWCRISAPIQTSMRARGLEHGHSERVAYEIRNLGLELYNKHDLLAQAQRTTKILLDLFDGLPELSEKAQADAAALLKIKKDAAASKKQQDEWAEAITYHAQIGVVLKDDLSISPSGIRWKNKTFPLDSVSQVRWGGVKHSVNGVSTGTIYTIGIGDGRSSVEISLRKEEIYTKFLSCLWRAVCVRLLFETVKRLKDGETLLFGTFKVKDDSVGLVRQKFLGRILGNDEVWVPVNQINILSYGGNFMIGAKAPQKLTGSASYIEHHNTHIIEHLMQASLKDISSGKLSGYWDK